MKQVAFLGTPFGPEYSCLAVGKQEIEVSEAYDSVRPEFYKRYIDDVFGATSMSREKLDRFISFVCNFHPAFQYTFEVSEPSEVSNIPLKFQNLCLLQRN